MSNLKVVPLNARDPSGHGGSDRPEPLVHQIRRLLTDHLGQATRRMMERVDDALFELAEKSDNTATQSLYFDAMREVRLKRAALEDAFRREFHDRFNARVEALKAPVTAHEHALGAVSFPSALGLLDDDAVEEDIAVANLVDKINNGCREQLFAIERRMAAVLGVANATGALNPTSPEVVCQSIRSALAHLQSGIKVRLIILKLFDRYVAAELEGIYLDCNQFLIRQGILPDLRSTAQTTPRRAWSRPSAATTDAGVAGEVAGNLDEQTVVSALKSLLMGGGNASGSAAAGALLGAVGPIPTNAIHQSLGGLTELQRGSASAWSNTVAADVAWAEGMRGEVNVLRSLKGTGLTAPLGPAGDLTIDVVAMLFDYILDDRNIPSALRALIGRLQIPVVKVALMDASFFSKKTHPARRLLNTLADAAIGWVGEAHASDALYHGIEDAVARINREFEHDVSLFAQVLDNFERLLAEGIAESNARTERTRGVVQGRERTEEAKRATREAVGRYVNDNSIPDPVRSFLTHHWHSVLISLGGAYGVDSDEYQDGLHTMDALVASIRPHTSPESRRRLSAVLPSLLAKLKSGMDRIDVPPIARKGFMTKLAKCHAEAVRGTVQPTGPLAPSDSAQFEAFISTEDALDINATESPAMVTFTPAESLVSPVPEAPASQWEQPIKGATMEAAIDALQDAPIDATENTAPLAVDEVTQPFEPTMPETHLVEHASAAGPFSDHQALAPPPEPEPALHFSVDSGPTATIDVPSEIVPASTGPTEACPGEIAAQVATTDSRDPLEITLPLNQPTFALASNDSESAPQECSLEAELLERTLETTPAFAPDGESKAVGGDLTAITPHFSAPTDQQHVLPPIEMLPAALSEGFGESQPSEGAKWGSVTEATIQPRETLADVLREKLLYDAEVPLTSLIDPAVIEERLSRSSPNTNIKAVLSTESDTQGFDFRQMTTEQILELMERGDLDIEEVTLAEQANEPTEAVSFADEFTHLVARLETGTWIEFAEEDGSKRQARLTWVNSATDVFMFTDRRGHKVQDRTRNGLIADFRRGAAKVVEQTASFDMWVGRIMEGLGKAVGGAR